MKQHKNNLQHIKIMVLCIEKKEVCPADFTRKRWLINVFLNPAFPGVLPQGGCKARIIMHVRVLNIP